MYSLYRFRIATPVIPEQKKPLEEPSSENNEEDLDDDDYDDSTNK